VKLTHHHLLLYHPLVVDGNNTRVVNSGQKQSKGLHCQNWYPHLKRDEYGFCVQGSDAIANCPFENIDQCNSKDKQRFLDTQMKPQYTQVI